MGSLVWVWRDYVVVVGIVGGYGVVAGQIVGWLWRGLGVGCGGVMGCCGVLQCGYGVLWGNRGLLWGIMSCYRVLWGVTGWLCAG